MSLQPRKTAPERATGCSPVTKLHQSVAGFEHVQDQENTQPKFKEDTRMEIENQNENKDGTSSPLQAKPTEKPPLSGIGRRKRKLKLSRLPVYKKKFRSPAATNVSNELMPDAPVGESSARSKSRRKSKRRSSFVMGRISMAVPVVDGAELYKTVPAELGEDVRLEKLTRVVFEHSMHKLEEEFHELPEFQKFQTYALDSAQGAIDDLRQLKEFEKLTSVVKEPSQEKPSEANLEENHLQAYIDLALQETQRYKQESKAWDALLEKFKMAAEDAERESKEHTEAPVIRAAPATLSRKQRSLLDGAPNYQDYLNRLDYMQQTTLLAVSTISRVARRHDHLFHQAERTAESLASRIYAAAFPGVDEEDIFDVLKSALDLS